MQDIKTYKRDIYIAKKHFDVIDKILTGCKHLPYMHEHMLKKLLECYDYEVQTHNTIGHLTQHTVILPKLSGLAEDECKTLKISIDTAPDSKDFNKPCKIWLSNEMTITYSDVDEVLMTDTDDLTRATLIHGTNRVDTINL